MRAQARRFRTGSAAPASPSPSQTLSRQPMVSLRVTRVGGRVRKHVRISLAPADGESLGAMGLSEYILFIGIKYE